MAQDIYNKLRANRPEQDEDTATATASTDGGWRNRIERCKNKRRELVPEWQINVDFRRGKVFDSTSDTARIAVAPDWAMTKSKQAQLFSQVPQIQLTPKHPSFAPAVPVFGKVVNDTLTKAKVGAAIDECLVDAINASGVGVVTVCYEARTEPVEVPAIDPASLSPEQQFALQQGLLKLPTMTVDRTVDSRFLVSHVEASDFLWPVEFTGSDFDEAPWVGRSGRMTWAEAKNAFNLTDDQKSDVLGTDLAGYQDRLSPYQDQAYGSSEDVVSFDEVFYWRHVYHPEEKYFKAIQHLVFVNGIDEPVIDEPWKGQKFDEQAHTYTGACRFPIRVLTLTNISGDCIPPSDSAVTRPQVLEMIEARSQMTLQRRHSMPLRWFDVNRVDPMIIDSLMKGTFQGLIPTQGSGAAAIGEVARAAYPREDFEFDRIIRQDLSQSWQIGANQVGNFGSGENSAAEANIVQTNFQTRIGQERARVGQFFVGIAEVLAGLVALYGDFDIPSVNQDGMQRLQSWDRTRINGEFVYDIHIDSTILLDSSQRFQRLTSFFNYAAKTGFVDLEPILNEMAALSGLDPAVVIRRPQPKGPESPNVSFRFSGSEDLRDPIALAVMMKAGQAPSPEELQAAMTLIKSAGTVATTTLVSPNQDEMTVTEHVPAAAESAQPLPAEPPVVPGAAPYQVFPPVATPQGGPQSGPPPTAVAPQDITMADLVNKRRGE